VLTDDGQLVSPEETLTARGLVSGRDHRGRLRSLRLHVDFRLALADIVQMSKDGRTRTSSSPAFALQIPLSFG